MSGIVRFAHVHVGEDSDAMAIVRTAGLTKVPTVLGFPAHKLVNPYTGAVAKQPEEYRNSTTSSRRIADFAASLLPTNLVHEESRRATRSSRRRAPRRTPRRTPRRRPWLATDPRLAPPVSILVTSKKETGALHKSLALAFRRRARFVEPPRRTSRWRAPELNVLETDAPASEIFARGRTPPPASTDTKARWPWTRCVRSSNAEPRLRRRTTPPEARATPARLACALWRGAPHRAGEDAPRDGGASSKTKTESPFPAIDAAAFESSVLGSPRGELVLFTRLGDAACARVSVAVGEALLRIAGHVNAGEVNVSDAAAARVLTVGRRRRRRTHRRGGGARRSRCSRTGTRPSLTPSTFRWKSTSLLMNTRRHRRRTMNRKAQRWTEAKRSPRGCTSTSPISSRRSRRAPRRRSCGLRRSRPSSWRSRRARRRAARSSRSPRTSGTTSCSRPCPSRTRRRRSSSGSKRRVAARRCRWPRPGAGRAADGRGRSAPPPRRSTAGSQLRADAHVDTTDPGADSGQGPADEVRAARPGAPLSKNGSPRGTPSAATTEGGPPTRRARRRRCARWRALDRRSRVRTEDDGVSNEASASRSDVGRRDGGDGVRESPWRRRARRGRRTVARRRSAARRPAGLLCERRVSSSRLFERTGSRRTAAPSKRARSCRSWRTC